jgi:hypothetical protein
VLFTLHTHGGAGAAAPRLLARAVAELRAGPPVEAWLPLHAPDDGSKLSPRAALRVRVEYPAGPAGPAPRAANGPSGPVENGSSGPFENGSSGPTAPRAAAPPHAADAPARRAAPRSHIERVARRALEGRRARRARGGGKGAWGGSPEALMAPSSGGEARYGLLRGAGGAGAIFNGAPAEASPRGAAEARVVDISPSPSPTARGAAAFVRSGSVSSPPAWGAAGPSPPPSAPPLPGAARSPARPAPPRAPTSPAAAPPPRAAAATPPGALAVPPSFVGPPARPARRTPGGQSWSQRPARAPPPARSAHPGSGGGAWVPVEPSSWVTAKSPAPRAPRPAPRAPRPAPRAPRPAPRARCVWRSRARAQEKYAQGVHEALLEPSLPLEPFSPLEPFADSGPAHAAGVPLGEAPGRDSDPDALPPPPARAAAPPPTPPAPATPATPLEPFTANGAALTRNDAIHRPSPRLRPSQWDPGEFGTPRSIVPHAAPAHAPGGAAPGGLRWGGQDGPTSELQVAPP